MRYNPETYIQFCTFKYVYMYSLAIIFAVYSDITDFDFRYIREKSDGLHYSVPSM